MNDERAAQGMQHLQAAAQEMIEAARAFLDVVEDFVADDEKLATVAEAVTSVARGARASTHPAPDPGDAPGDGSVQHIRVS